jgi:hypothetical protein
MHRLMARTSRAASMVSIRIDNDTLAVTRRGYPVKSIPARYTT